MLSTSGCIIPHIVPGSSACLGVPRHADNESQFIAAVLENLGHRHDILLDLVVLVADEDPFAALRLLQVCGVQRFGHIISAVPTPLVADFAGVRDEVVKSTFAVI